MKKKKIYIMVLTATLSLAQPMTVLAVTESDVRVVGKEAAAGNLFIWFLCAIAFLRISQKIHSFLSSLGINVGHTGGNMMAELMVAARGLTTAKNVAGSSSFRGGSFRVGGGGGSINQSSFPLRRACRGCGEAFYPGCHADRDWARRQPHQPQGF